jgi:cytosine/adenosine deaminase-related metal-dependent hydrolase
VERTTLLRNGILLTMDDQLGEFRGDVLIEGARILEVAPSIDVEADEVIDLEAAVVLPGLVDSHVHLWQAPIRGISAGCWGREYFGVVHPLAARYRATDLYAATFAAGAELLIHGVTTAVDFCHSMNSPAHADASLSALSDVGIRALFGYSFRERPEMREQGFTSFAHRAEVLRKLQVDWAPHERVGIVAALNNIDHLTREEHAREVGLARELGLLATLHSNLQEQVTQSWEQGLLGPDLLWVHAGAISENELDLLREHGGAIICTPEIEAANMTITPVVSRALQHRIPIGFGSDAPAVVNSDLLTQLRIGHALFRMTDAQNEHRNGRTGARTSWAPSVDAAKLLKMATIGTAEMLGMADRIGSLTPGKQADIAVVSAEPFGLAEASPADHVMFHSSGRDLDHVFVAGRRLVSRGNLVEVDIAQMRRRADEVRDWVLGRAPGTDWEEIDEQTRKRYEAGQGSAS